MTHHGRSEWVRTVSTRELLDDLDDVSLTIRVVGAEGRQLTSDDLWRLALIKPTARIPEVTVTEVRSLGEWRATASDLAAGMAREIYLRFNCDIALPDVRRITERIVLNRRQAPACTSPL
jgi:hypothetical protein